MSGRQPSNLLMEAKIRERILKLRALAEPGRGGTKAERQLASEKAAKLEAKYGKVASEPRRAPKQRRIFTTGTSSAGTAFVYWSFNPATGVASNNVNVKRHQDISNWHIEIEFDEPTAVGQRYAEQLEKQRRAQLGR
jgi:hypothetical protein